MASSSGKVEPVAPSSAPMLVMVPLPVHEIERTPGPKYSITRLVPPFTVSTPQRWQMTSLGEVQPFMSPLRKTPSGADGLDPGAGGGHHPLRLARLPGLKERQLGRGVLQDDAVGPQEEVALSGVELLSLRAVEVGEEDLLGERERTAEPLAHDRQV